MTDHFFATCCHNLGCQSISMPIASVAAVQILGVDRDTVTLVEDNDRWSPRWRVSPDVLPDGLEFQADGLICVEHFSWEISARINTYFTASRYKHLPSMMFSEVCLLDSVLAAKRKSDSDGTSEGHSIVLHPLGACFFLLMQRPVKFKVLEGMHVDEIYRSPSSPMFTGLSFAGTSNSYRSRWW